MERNEIMGMLQQIIREAVDNEEVVINDTTVASDVEGWDSLAQILIVGELQNELGVKFTSAEVNNCSNVGELVAAIIAKL
jgi:acyl carrier protein